MADKKSRARGKALPILMGVLPIVPAQMPTEMVAGLTLAALAIPEVMGYTKIAGMPVVTGLYTILVPMLLFALFGSSRHLVVGADSATAAIMAAGLVGIAASGSTQYVAYAGILALMAAGMLLVARLLRLGFIANFLSRTVLIGFLTGVGIQVAIGEISGMLGLPGGGRDSVGKLLADVQQLGEINWYTLVISVAVVAIIVGARRINKRIPGALIAVVGSIVLGSAVDLAAHGVATLGHVPSGLPAVGIPSASLSGGTAGKLISVAFSMFIVILAQSAATSRAYAARYNERFSENMDLIGLSLANIGAGLTGTFVVNGSPTKTQMVDSAGGRSQLSQITTVIVVLLVLIFLTGPLSFMPTAVLSAVVFLIGIELIDVNGMRSLLAQRPVEFWLAVITAGLVVFAGVEQAILLAIVLSLVVHLRHGYHPRNSIVIRKGDFYQPVQLREAAELAPGLLVYRFNHNMYYANSELLSDQVIQLQKSLPTPVTWICIDMIAVDDVDYTAAATVRNLCKELKQLGARLVFADTNAHVRGELERSGITELVGEDAFFADLNALLAAYRSATSGPQPPIQAGPER
jgi:SulP family sulfate permease